MQYHADKVYSAFTIQLRFAAHERMRMDWTQYLDMILAEVRFYTFRLVSELLFVFLEEDSAQNIRPSNSVLSLASTHFSHIFRSNERVSQNVIELYLLYGFKRLKKSWWIENWQKWPWKTGSLKHTEFEGGWIGLRLAIYISYEEFRVLCDYLGAWGGANCRIYHHFGIFIPKQRTDVH